MRKAVIASIIIIVAQFVAAFILYPSMPARMVVHWNINGEANGYGSRFMGLYLLPLMQIILLPFFMVLPRIDPKHGIDKFREEYDWFIIGFVGFMTFINGISIMWNLGWRFDFTQVIAPVIGLLFYGLGVLLSRAKMNWFVGIRTPWTMSSEEVWNRTHKLGGMLFKLCGAITFIGLLFGGWATFVIAMGSILVSTVYLIVYSYVEYQKIEKDE
jgi:uncharacterized membrane protein